jgi:TetR/AcrR family transcriptional repressor of nem operon
MRYEKGHKESTRQRILEIAAARFRRDGIEKVGVADVMGEAGLTVGGFYSHFSSKEELVREAVGSASSRSLVNFAKRVDEGGMEAWIRYYLSPAHRDNPERGCAAAALSSELARHPASSRESFCAHMEKLLGVVEGQLPATMTAAVRKQTAVGIFATLVGALQMARTVTCPDLSQQIMNAGIATALSLAQIPNKNFKK